MLTEQRAPLVQVWDPVVRIFHWSLVIGVAIDFLTEEETLGVHVGAGYVVGALLLVRIAWGFVGSPHARFADFVYGPATVIAHLGDLLRLRGKHYLGYSPAGGAMVIVLLVLLGVTVATGIAVDTGAGGGEAAGPPLPSISAAAEEDEEGEAGEEGEGGEAEGGESAVGDLHELLANVTLAFIVLHIAGVLLASLVHRENLAKAMITGRKRPL